MPMHLLLKDLVDMLAPNAERELIREIERSLWKHAEFDRLYPEPQGKDVASAA